MNKRIRELAEQARKKPMGDSWTYRYFGEFEEKFAELIVGECLGIADEFEVYVNQGGLVDRIKQHFGVEE